MARPAVAAALSVGALALLLGFRTPAPPPVPHSGAVGAIRTGYSGTLDGGVVQTPYGTVQVRVVLSGGSITDVSPLQMPNSMQLSSQIAQYAAPRLRSEVLSAQSANVDTVSGATYTSEGYLQSLQSALDKAA